MKSKAIVFVESHQVSIETVEIPEPGPGEVLLEALYTVVGPGTELRCLSGMQPGADFPFIPGYSFVGYVTRLGPGATLPLGTLACCPGTAHASVNRAWGGHTQFAVQSEKEVFPIPEGVDPLWGAAAHLAAIAYRGVRLSQTAPHESVAVIGLGPIGQCSSRLHALTGARVIGSDRSPARVLICMNAGLEAFVPQEELAEGFLAYLPEGADVVVDATGIPEVLPQAITIAKSKSWDDCNRPGARLVIQGSYPGPIELPYLEASMKELSLWLPCDAHPCDLRAVLDLMRRGKLNLDGIVSDIRTPKDAPGAYAELMDVNTSMITVGFKWS